MKLLRSYGRCFTCVLLLLAGCQSKHEAAVAPSAEKEAPVYFSVDPKTAGSISGTVYFAGKRSPIQVINMSEDPACVEAHQGRAHDESLMVGANGALANAFIYVASGLEGKVFAVPSEPVAIDQRGCWFRPRVLGVQVGQVLKVVNSDPVTHNIHPLAQVNREWNHSQGPGDAPLSRKFLKPEIMIPVKCNIHGWMHAFIGVLDHPYFAVSKGDGTFKISNVPPGTYRIVIWQEKLGTQEQQITLQPSGNAVMKVTFNAK